MFLATVQIRNTNSPAPTHSFTPALHPLPSPLASVGPQTQTKLLKVRRTMDTNTGSGCSTDQGHSQSPQWHRAMDIQQILGAVGPQTDTWLLVAWWIQISPWPQVAVRPTDINMASGGRRDCGHSCGFSGDTSHGHQRRQGWDRNTDQDMGDMHF